MGMEKMEVKNHIEELIEFCIKRNVSILLDDDYSDMVKFNKSLRSATIHMGVSKKTADMFIEKLTDF